VRDDVEHRRSSGGQDDRLAPEQAFVVARRRDTLRVIEKAGDVPLVTLGVAGDRQPLVALDPGEHDRRRGRDRPRNRDRIVGVAHPGSAAREADLEQRIQRPLEAE
jgi:hypothetical protein